MATNRVVPEQGTVALAIDIGGTKLAVGLVDCDATVVAQARRPTEGADGEALFAGLMELVDEVRASAGVDPAVVGVGCGGPMTRGGATVSPINITQWQGFALRDRLSDAMGLPVRVDNDAKALTLAEGWVGAAVGVDNYLGMVVSTGVGGGVVLDGRLLDGADANAGHIGHVVVEPDGHVCGCGGVGCLEAEASGTAIAALTGRPPAEADAATVQRTGTMVGRAVASVVNLLDLQLAVVAGSVALGFGAPFFAAAQAEIDYRARLQFSRATVIMPAGLGADAPLIGAAAVAWHRPDGSDPGPSSRRP